jgi:hypothetical protein
MAGRQKKPRSAKVLMISVAVLGLLLAALPTALVITVGLIPTLVALIVDLTPGRYLTRCVAGLNVAGLAPFIHKLWLGGHTMSAALAIVTDAYAWLVIYAAAAIGWLLFLGLPGAVAIFRQLNAKRRIYILRERQRTLLNEWGDSILTAEAKREREPAIDGKDAPVGPESAADREVARRMSPGRG